MTNDTKTMDDKTRKILIGFQKNEITEYWVYKHLSAIETGDNKEIFNRIAEDELAHYHFWKQYTGAEVLPSKFRILKHKVLLQLFGVTFTIKLMERDEGSVQQVYKKILNTLPETETIIKEENKHEDELIKMVYEERLDYIGSMILGLNDALVELLGTLAGLTFVFQSTKLVGIGGLVTGVAAALSMMSSEYLARKSEGGKRNPVTASIYTGIAYIFTVIFLVLPYFVFSKIYVSFTITLLFAFFIILIFTYFISVIQDLSFKLRFLEMAGISIGVALISFLIGFLLRAVWNVDI
ncbi:MAG: VIT1/CCC1 transporter family protein [Patescibacteria group bacterium]|nr:VIT1/CCC1 transporter family protein [Patescibacteria group bacterium]